MTELRSPDVRIEPRTSWRRPSRLTSATQRRRSWPRSPTISACLARPK